MLSVKGKVALILVGLFISLLFCLIGVLAWSIIGFSFTRQIVDAEMKNYDILAFIEESGILVYITETSHSSEVHVFVPSMILSRYRLHRHSEYNNEFCDAVPGKLRLYALVIDGTVIRITPSRYRFYVEHVLFFLTLTIVTTSACYRVHQRKLLNAESK